MIIGRMNERIRIESQSVARDDYGAEVKSWQTFVDVWATVRQMTGTENLRSLADRTVATLPYRINIRYRADITPKMRVVWRGKALEILSVFDPDGAKRETVLVATDVEI
jgi:SPP1 family predicted phage head-tail adaptor